MSALVDFLRCAPGPCLNTATHDELLAVPEIGSKLATRLLEHAPFDDWSDVARVRGIGPRGLAQLRHEFPRLSPIAFKEPRTMHTPTTRELFDSYMDDAIASIKREAFIHAIRETAKSRAPTLGDILDLVCDSGSWGGVDLDDSLDLGDLLGTGHDSRSVAELMAEMFPDDDVDPDDPAIDLALSELSAVN